MGSTISVDLHREQTRITNRIDWMQEKLHLVHLLVKDTKGRANWMLANIQFMPLFQIYHRQAGLRADNSLRELSYKESCWKLTSGTIQ